jgi:anti-sigma regulatory factor (Ser/Thr protein kinase)
VERHLPGVLFHCPVVVVLLDDVFNVAVDVFWFDDESIRRRVCSFVLVDGDHQGADAVGAATLANKGRDFVLGVVACGLLFDFYPSVVVVAKRHLVLHQPLSPNGFPAIVAHKALQSVAGGPSIAEQWYPAFDVGSGHPPRRWAGALHQGNDLVHSGEDVFGSAEPGEECRLSGSADGPGDAPVGSERLGAWDVSAAATSVPRLRRGLLKTIAGRGFDQDAVGLAVTEAVSNTIRHAYPGPGGRVRLSAYASADELLVIVADEGVGTSGFTPRNHPKNPGIGLALIHALCDARIEPAHNGTTVTMRFARIALSQAQRS